MYMGNNYFALYHSTGETIFGVKVTFFTKPYRRPPFLIVQTTALIVSCSNVQSDWENICF